MKITFLCFESSLNWVEAPLLDYTKQIQKLNSNFQIKVLKSKSFKKDDGGELKKHQAESLLKNISEKDFAILFDERGKALGSLDFSKAVQSSLETGKPQVVFIVGGAYGVSEDVFKRADLTLRLSDLVLNGGVSQIVALEQLYRAFNILKNTKYHH